MMKMKNLLYLILMPCMMIACGIVLTACFGNNNNNPGGGGGGGGGGGFNSNPPTNVRVQASVDGNQTLYRLLWDKAQGAGHNYLIMITGANNFEFTISNHSTSSTDSTGSLTLVSGNPDTNVWNSDIPNLTPGTYSVFIRVVGGSVFSQPYTWNFQGFTQHAPDIVRFETHNNVYAFEWGNSVIEYVSSSQFELRASWAGQVRLTVPLTERLTTNGVVQNMILASILIEQFPLGSDIGLQVRVLANGLYAASNWSETIMVRTQTAPTNLRVNTNGTTIQWNTTQGVVGHAVKIDGEVVAELGGSVTSLDLIQSHLAEPNRYNLVKGETYQIQVQKIAGSSDNPYIFESPWISMNYTFPGLPAPTLNVFGSPTGEVTGVGWNFGGFTPTVLEYFVRVNNSAEFTVGTNTSITREQLLPLITQSQNNTVRVRAVMTDEFMDAIGEFVVVRIGTPSISLSGASLSWSSSGTGTASYIVKVGDLEHNAGNVTSFDLSILHSQLALGTQYSIQVKAVAVTGHASNLYFDSPFGNIIEYTTPDTRTGIYYSYNSLNHTLNTGGTEWVDVTFVTGGNTGTYRDYLNSTSIGFVEHGPLQYDPGNHQWLRTSGPFPDYFRIAADGSLVRVLNQNPPFSTRTFFKELPLPQESYWGNGMFVEINPTDPGNVEYIEFLGDDNVKFVTHTSSDVTGLYSVEFEGNTVHYTFEWNGGSLPSTATLVNGIISFNGKTYLKEPS